MKDIPSIDHVIGQDHRPPLPQVLSFKMHSQGDLTQKVKLPT